MSKEAVVFLLDAHPSMNAPYPSDSSSGSTRLACAKEAIEGMISQLMIQSPQNEVGVIVVNTDVTRHQMQVKNEFESEPKYPHMTELTMPGVTKPNVELLQDIRSVSCSTSDYSGADVCRAMALAENALRQRTFKKKYRRRLVVFTDAAHEVKMSTDELLKLIDKLRDLECTLTVIGVDFEMSAEFEEPLPAEQAAKKEETDNEEEEEEEAESVAEKSVSDDSETTVGEDSDEEMEEVDAQDVKQKNENLLIGFAKLTGGSIIAASTMKEISDAALGKRIPKSMKKSIEFHIAPGLTLNAKCSLLLSKAPFPSLKKQAVQLDEYDRPKLDGNNEVMTKSVLTITDHWDRDDQDVDVTLENRTSAFRYGADFIPMSTVDFVGLQTVRSDPAIRILGYTDQSHVPRALMIGPPYAVWGDQSHRVCGAIAALSQALDRLQQVAICAYVKTKRADPVLGALFPLQEEDASQPTRLFFMQLPFADDIRKFSMLPLESTDSSQVCDKLIDSLMLPSDAIRSERIANPAIRCFRKTIKNRAVNPLSTGIVTAREHHSVDDMTTPGAVLERARPALETFRTTFARKRKAEEDGKAKKKPRHWGARDD